jgi:phage-related protein/DNA-binding XRE family transcriptional regulator
MYDVELLSPAVEFLGSLEAKLRAKAPRTIELLRQFGPQLPMPHSKRLSGYPLWELRTKQGSSIVPMFYFAADRTVYVVASGYVKKTDKTSRSEIERAMRLMTDLFGGREMKTTQYRDFLREQLKDDEFKSEYENLEEEFTIAREVIELRQRHHLTQKELAERAGTSQPAIARLESGNYKNLSLSFIRRIAWALDAVPEIHLRSREPNAPEPAVKAT